MPAARATKAVITNAISAAQDCGLDVTEVIVSKDGTVRIVAGGPQTPLPSSPDGVDAWDQTTGRVL